MDNTDTICALATGTSGAISIIRIDGPGALECARRVWRGKNELDASNARKMLLGAAAGDRALAVYFAAPGSYSGNDLVEFHCHGGVRVGRAVLEAALASGARMAEPGEFTFRAFLNGKLDLVQAEAVCDVIEASGTSALNLAERQLAGSLSEKFRRIREDLVYCLGECESRLDFPEEELDWDVDLGSRINAAMDTIAGLQGSMEAGAIFKEGVRIAIAGRPNAGKSSLLNALLGFDRSIVTEIAGTTRDTVEEMTVLRGVPVRLTDTAGLCESDNPVEKLGVERSFRSIRSSELVFWVLDASSEDLMAEVRGMELWSPARTIAVWNKIDLVPDAVLPGLPVPAVRISARTGNGLDDLLDAVVKLIGGADGIREPEVAVNARHHQLLGAAAGALPEAASHWESGEYELAALQLREAIRQLGRITGETVDPDILSDIFSRFCIGK